MTTSYGVNFHDKCRQRHPLQTNDVKVIVSNFDKNTYKNKSVQTVFKGGSEYFSKKRPALIHYCILRNVDAPVFYYPLKAPSKTVHPPSKLKMCSPENQPL